MLKFKKVKKLLLIVAELGLVFTATAGLISCDNQSQDKTKEFEAKLAEFKSETSNPENIGEKDKRYKVDKLYKEVLAFNPENKAAIQDDMITFICNNFFITYAKTCEKEYTLFSMQQYLENETKNINVAIGPANVKGLAIIETKKDGKSSFSVEESGLDKFLDATTVFNSLDASSASISYDYAYDVYDLADENGNGYIGFSENNLVAFGYKDNSGFGFDLMVPTYTKDEYDIAVYQFGKIQSGEMQLQSEK